MRTDENTHNGKTHQISRISSGHSNRVVQLGESHASLVDNKKPLSRSGYKPQDSFILLMQKEPLVYPDDKPIDKVFLELFTHIKSLTLRDIVTIIESEKKEWQLVSLRYATEHPSWKIRIALAKRACDYFTVDNRAKSADILVHTVNGTITCEVISYIAENSFRLYRNNLDTYLTHVQSFDLAIENLTLLQNDINTYCDVMEKKTHSQLNEEDFELLQEIILEKIEEYKSHWGEIAESESSHSDRQSAFTIYTAINNLFSNILKDEYRGANESKPDKTVRTRKNFDQKRTQR